MVLPSRDGGRLSSGKQITITINDVNEKPIINANMKATDMQEGDKSGDPNGDNKVCSAIFAMDEIKKNGDDVIDGQSVSAFATAFQATDPDEKSANKATWGTLKYRLTPGWKNSDLFDIDENSGEITPKTSKMSEFDFEKRRYKLASEGIPDGQMRINVVAYDAEHLHCRLTAPVHIYQ